MNILAMAAAGAQAIPRLIEESLVDPFVAAVKLTFTEMAGTEVVVLGSFRKPHVMTLGEISALIPYRGNDHAFILGFPNSTAHAVSKRILADLAEESDDALKCDCLGEVANVVAGQAKALLAETPYHFAFSTPRVTHGQLPAAETDAARDCLVVIFRCELGDFALQICLQ